MEDKDLEQNRSPKKRNILKLISFKYLLLFLLLVSLPILIIASRNQSYKAASAQISTQDDIVDLEEEFMGDSDLDLSSNVLEPDEYQVVPRVSNPVILENQKLGTTSWSFVGNTQGDDSVGQIKGYASKTSVGAGGDIEIKVTVNPAQSFTMDIFRMGWYSGKGGRLMKSVGPLSGIRQASCPMSTSTGMVECKWRTSYTLHVPTDWLSGSYIIKLRNSRNYVNYVNFTVRDNRRADFLFQNSVTTWQAYNPWGGKGLYNGSPRAVKVSFDRPYSKNGTRLFSWEYNMIRFMERNGYDVSYSTNVDTHESGGKILNYKAFLSVGHDEYWSWEMRDNVENARNRGVNLGFFGGNDSYWQIRFENSSEGVSNRVIVGYKERYTSDPNYRSQDPARRRKTTALWRSSVVGRAEQQMLGTLYVKNLGTHDNNLDLIVRQPNHFAFAGTGLGSGDKIPKVYGYEYNQKSSSYSNPPGGEATELGEGIRSGVPSASTTIYKAPSGAFVFSAGSTDWSWRLDNFSFHVANSKIQKITANILDKFAAN